MQNPDSRVEQSPDRYVRTIEEIHVSAQWLYRQIWAIQGVECKQL